MVMLLESVVLFAAIVNVASTAGTNEYNPYKPEWRTKLLADLLVDYHPSVPPTHEGPVPVNMGLSISYFDFINEPHQLATVNAWSSMTWTDPRLRWDKEDYNGTRKVVIDRSDIWIPDISLSNGARHTLTVDADTIVYNTGKIRMYRSCQIEFICDMDLTFFPYDEQECQLKFSSWHYSSETINLTASENVDHSDIRSATVFEITNFTMQRVLSRYSFHPYDFIAVHYNISMKRSSSAYTTKLVLPSVLTGFLVLSTFLLPTASHEKITLCGILFLCLLVLLTYLHLIVPGAGDTILGDYLGFALFVDFFATILAVVSYNVKVGVFSTPKQPDIPLVDKAEGGENDSQRQIPKNRKMEWLRYLDVVCFVLFSIVFIVGLAIILARRE